MIRAGNALGAAHEAILSLAFCLFLLGADALHCRSLWLGPLPALAGAIVAGFMPRESCCTALLSGVRVFRLPELFTGLDSGKGATPAKLFQVSP